MLTLLEDLLEVSLDADPLLSMPSVHTGVDPEIASMAGTNRPRPHTYSRRRRLHSASTTTSLANALILRSPRLSQIMMPLLVLLVLLLVLALVLGVVLSLMMIIDDV